MIFHTDASFLRCQIVAFRQEVRGAKFENFGDGETRHGLLLVYILAISSY